MVERKNMTNEKLKPVSPGELLNEDFIIPMGLTKYRLAKDIGVAAQRIGDIVNGKRSISADTDLRLCKYFGLSNGYWLRVQAKYDTAMVGDKIQQDIDKIMPYTARKQNKPALYASSGK
jgi:addiction module HigA family antidote